MNDIKEDESDKKVGGIVSTIGKIKKIKHIEIIIAVVAVLIMLGIYFTTMGGSGKTPKANDKVTATNYCTNLEHQLEELVSGIKGAGKARVLISWESSIELILAQNTSNSSGSTSSNPIIVQNSGSSSPVILKEIYPKAVGVLITCTGGNDPTIKVNLIIAVSTLLNIPTDKVIVYAMAK